MANATIKEVKEQPENTENYVLTCFNLNQYISKGGWVEYLVVTYAKS